MPPPDTTYIPGQTGPPPPTGDRYIDSLIQVSWNERGSNTVVVRHNQEGTGNFDGTAILLLLLFGVFLTAITNALISIPGAVQRKQEQKKIRKLVGVKGEECHQLLMDCNPYYRSLPEYLKERFVARTLHFSASKEFCFHEIEEKEYIPVLVSGAAVQLTFGMHNYLLDYFEVIHVMRNEYVLHTDNETYLGHVSKTGIHLSWNNFLQGYQYYSDSVNLGLHEMAHALQFDAVLGYENQYDRSFRKRMNSYYEEGLPVFRAMREGAQLVFSPYSTTNFDEFWAVSVENFFECSALFKERLPALYEEMCTLLNQDPLLEHKIIDPDLV